MAYTDSPMVNQWLDRMYANQIKTETMKRFKIHDWKGSTIFESATTEEVYNEIKSKEMVSEEINIYCGIDEITIEGAEFVQSFDEGECPGDLQFF